jgi:CRISPR-associated protein Cas1
MIKRTVEISRQPAHLSVELDQLVLRRDGQIVGRVPCEDLGVLLVDHPASTYTHAALATLMRFDTAVVVCGRDHLPAGILLPLAEHTQVVWRIEDQMRASLPTKKRLWRQLVSAKIRAQAENLPAGSAAHKKLSALASQVRSGDPANVEAQAARVYWGVWLAKEEGFYRDPAGPSPNHFLNYGYAVLRAAVARAIVGSGLAPAIGIHHSNRSNAFCLADDLLEPLRPLVDKRAREIHLAGTREMDRAAKAGLLETLTQTVRIGERTGPLFVQLHRMVASFVRCLAGTASELEIPVPCT